MAQWILVVFTLLGLCGVDEPGLFRGDPVARANEAIENNAGAVQYLPPSAFPSLPLAFREALEKQGCTIPQQAFEATPSRTNNVIRGHFARKGQNDWAALCSNQGRSRVVIFWGGTASCASEVGASDDQIYVQSNSQGRAVFSRQITPIGRAGILRSSKAAGFAGKSAPPGYPLLDHLGILDSFVGKASVIHFCSNGKWFELQGMD